MEKMEERQRVLDAVNEIDSVAIDSEDVQRATGLPTESVNEGLKWLKNRGLITSLSEGWGGLPIRVSLTTEGEDLLEDGISLREWNQRRNNGNAAGMTVTNNVSGDFHGQQIGDNNQMTVTVHTTPDQIRKLITELQEAGLTAEADAVAEATDNGNSPSGLIGVLGKVGAGLAHVANLTTIAATLNGII